jgi:hypothetical protein
MYGVLAQDKTLWRTLLSSKVGLAFVIAFFWVSLSLASAQIQDITPPTLTAFSFTPTTINTATGPANVAVSLSATDDLSGVRTIYALFVSPSGRQSHITVPAFVPPAANVSATATVTFPQFSEAGTWRVAFVFVGDVVGNDSEFDYDTTTLAQLGFPTQLVVGEQEDDITPPVRSISGDFDADSEKDLTVWRPVEGNWYIVFSATGTWTRTQWGLPGDVPVPGDFDADGETDLAVWRPVEGNWYIVFSSTGTWTVTQWGLPGDIPVPADYDGDGKTDLAVWRPHAGTWYIINRATSTFTFTIRQWGLPGDVPVPGDYDGDGKTDLAVWRPRQGNWYVINSSMNTSTVYQWGLPGDIPVPGDYDGDGETDFAVWRPVEGNWYIVFSATGTWTRTQWGLPGDVPL